MEITAEQFEKIKSVLPVQRGNVNLPNLQFLNAVLYVAEHGCKWRGLPSRFGNWHSIYTRMNRCERYLKPIL
jgi:transposase